MVQLLDNLFRNDLSSNLTYNIFSEENESHINEITSFNNQEETEELEEYKWMQRNSR